MHNMISGWCHKWILPSQLKSQPHVKINQIIPGPFSSPRLIKTCPLIVPSPTAVTWNNDKIAKNSKTGIPDPWMEYLILNSLYDNRKGYRDYKVERLTLFCNGHIRIIDRGWKKLGISFEQGIPDSCKSFNILNRWQGKKEMNKKSKKKI